MRPLGPIEQGVASLAAYDYLADGKLSGTSRTFLQMAAVNRGFQALDQFQSDLDGAVAAWKRQPLIEEALREHFITTMPMFGRVAYDLAFSAAEGDFDPINADGTLFTCRNGVTINSVAMMIYCGKSAFQIVRDTGLTYKTVNGVAALMEKAAKFKVEHLFGLPITNPRTEAELGIVPDPAVAQAEADAQRARSVIKFVLIFGVAAILVAFWKAYA